MVGGFESQRVPPNVWVLPFTFFAPATHPFTRGGARACGPRIRRYLVARHFYCCSRRSTTEDFSRFLGTGRTRKGSFRFVSVLLLISLHAPIAIRSYEGFGRGLIDGSALFPISNGTRELCKNVDFEGLNGFERIDSVPAESVPHSICFRCLAIYSKNGVRAWFEGWGIPCPCFDP